MGGAAAAGWDHLSERSGRVFLNDKDSSCDNQTRVMSGDQYSNEDISGQVQGLATFFVSQSSSPDSLGKTMPQSRRKTSKSGGALVAGQSRKQPRESPPPRNEERDRQLSECCKGAATGAATAAALLAVAVALLGVSLRAGAGAAGEELAQRLFRHGGLLAEWRESWSGGGGGAREPAVSVVELIESWYE